MEVVMKHPKTGDLKGVKVGWSWTLFLFSGLFGLPLFLRRLYGWGALFFLLWVLNLLTITMLDPVGPTAGIRALSNLTLWSLMLGLQIFLGIKGNKMTAKNYLEHNWTFLDPDSEVTKMAKRRWGITV